MTVDSDFRLKHNWQMNGIIKSIRLDINRRRHLHHRGSLGGTAQKPVVAGTNSLILSVDAGPEVTCAHLRGSLRRPRLRRDFHNFEKQVHNISGIFVHASPGQ